MCGIAGIYNRGGLDDAEAKDRLSGVVSLLRHRGPDASGVVSWPDRGVAFAHRRLSILDLDPRADQPMLSPEGDVLITFNGEIYNFRELREELRKAGAAFRTESDTEVIVQGYRVWGLERLLPRLCGMFAFALYDRSRDELILARDRAGKKPLYYSEDADGGRDGVVAFCSELGGLLRLRPKPAELDAAGLDAYLHLKFAPAPGSLIRGVRKVPGGFYWRKRGGNPGVLTRYWRPWDGGAAGLSSAAEALDRLEDMFCASIRRRLISDVPVCLFLSGGIDSSLIAAYLGRCGAREMTAYSIGYRGPAEYSEFQYSRMVASRFPVRYQEIVLDAREALATLEDETTALDEPNSDWVWVPLHHLSRRAHQDGFKVALVGEGSDELFFGYDVMLKGLRQIERFQNPAWRSAARAGAALLAPVYRYSSKGHRRYGTLRRAASGDPVYIGSSVGFEETLRTRLAGPRLEAAGDGGTGMEYIRSLREAYRAGAPDPNDAVNWISYLEFNTKMSEVLLSRVDRVTMRHSLEARCPFLDHQLVELAFAIPGGWKIPGRRLKGLLKELARRTLPAEIIDRKKMGFSFPFKEWLRGELGPVVERTLNESRLFADGWVDRSFCLRLLEEHRSGRFDHAPRLWMIFDLCRWYDRWLAR